MSTDNRLFAAMKKPLVRAVLACAIFTAAGLLELMRVPLEGTVPLLAGYYFILVFNTYFSIRAIAAITPDDYAQQFFDGVLVCIYCVLAFSMGWILYFLMVATALFVTSLLKYAHLRHIADHDSFLMKKIWINVLGAFLPFSCLVIALVGYQEIAAQILFGAFAIANVYLLFINPMYRIEAE